MVTAGLKWAPEIGPNVRINASERGGRGDGVGQQSNRVVPAGQPIGHDARPDDRCEKHRGTERLGGEPTRQIDGHRSCFRITMADAGQAD